MLKERRSVHQFEDRPVPPELVLALLEAAVWAPNHRMTQPWRFVLTCGEGRKRIARAMTGVRLKNERDPERIREIKDKIYKNIMSVPAFLTVVMREHPHPIVRMEDYAATCCVVHNFSLLAWEKGIGLVWETYDWLYDPDFRAALGVKEGETIVGNLHLGYPARVPPPQPRADAASRLTVVDRDAPDGDGPSG